MLKRVVHLSVVSWFSIFAAACATGGEDDGSSFGSFTGATTQTTQTTVNDDMDDDLETGDGMGDGDGDPSGDGDPTGDGDGDPTTGDGDGDPTTGDGDGDPTTGDGDGDPSCGNGVIDPGETCDGTNFNGATCVSLGFDMGALSCTNCAVSTATCSNSAQPGLGQLYSHCLVPENCPGLDGCATVTMQGETEPFDGFCTNFCNSDAECFANTGGTAVPKCNTEPSRYCELDCSGGKTCPGGMMCINLQGGKQLCY
jgi:hypothetical protein